MTTLSIDGVDIDIIRKKMKTMRIVVFRATGKVRISAPLRLQDHVIKAFAIARLPWIKKHQARFREKPALDFSEADQGAARKHLLQIVPALLSKWEQVIGVKVAKFTIRKMQTRWGSCNVRARTISLNLALASKPIQCLEMIIVHELVHLLERYHNKRFYALMDRFMPSWALYEAMLDGQLVDQL